MAKTVGWFFSLVVILCSSVARAESNVERMARQFREFCLPDNGDRILDDIELHKTPVATVPKQVATLNNDGSWADIDYASGARASWPAYDHLTRVLSMMVYVRRPDTAPADAAKCLAAVHGALAYWREHDFQCPNWWYNDIGVPKITGTIALLLADDLTRDERAYIVDTVLPRSKVGAMTGQNRVWLAGNGLMRGALLGDEALVRTAAGVIADEIRVSTKEGVQPDWTFQQHGPQQELGNYGLAYAVEMGRWADVLRGTTFAFPEEKLSVLRGFLLRGIAPVMWRGALDISACGRQLAPGSPRDKATRLCGAVRSLAVVDAQHGAEYQALVQRQTDQAANDLVGNWCCWRSDYLVHRRPTWMATVKMHSSRVMGGESINSQNLSGLHLADGALFLYRTGREFDDIFPVWDWRQIPGTTAALDDASLQPKKGEFAREPDFVGGVSDGTTGCAAMDFRRGGLTAKKAWFFVADMIVCLGADIQSSGDGPVVTTVNQCLLSGPIAVHQGGETRVISGADSRWNANADSPVDWIEHDGVRYVFPVPQALSVSAEHRTGDWRKVFDTPSTPREPVTKDVFSLWLDHARPKGPGYAYWIEPTGGAAEPSVQILSNTSKLQAVKIGANCAAAVFWSGETAMLDGTAIEVDQPCLMLIESRADGQHVTVADPTQKLTMVRLKVDGQAHEIKLPQEDEAGKSVEMKIQTK